MQRKGLRSIRSFRSLNGSFEQSAILENDLNSSLIRKLQSRSISQSNTVILNRELGEQKIYTLANLIKNHHNPFLINQLKNYFLDWDPRFNASISLPIYFNFPLIQQRVDEFQEVYFSKSSEKEKKEMIESFRKQLLALRYSKYLGWQAAGIFLKSTQIKKIPLQLSQKLMKLIEKAQTERIIEFLNDQIYQSKDFDKIQFVAQITKQKLELGRSEAKKQITIKNPETLISQMIKTMPVQNDSLEKLMKNLTTCEKLVGQLIQLKCVKNAKFFNGKIKQAQYKTKNGKKVLQLNIQSGLANKVLQFVIEEYPKVVKVSWKIKLPLSEEIDFESIVKWQKLSAKDKFVYEKQNYHFSIEINNNFFGQASFLPKGKYRIRCIINKQSSNKSYDLIFQQVQKELTYKITVLNKTLQNAMRALRYQGRTYAYQQFTNSYFVTRIQIDQLTYSTKKQIAESLRIYESHVFDGKYFYQKLKRIQGQKKRVLNILQTEVENFQHSEFFMRFIQNRSIDQDYLKKIGVLPFIKLIVEQKKFVKELVTYKEIINEIIMDFNYATLVNKENTLESIKTIRMFIKSQEYCESMKGREIIVVYGNTGSGKSTTINYLTGVPLQEGINECGDKIILINQNQLKKISKDQYAPAKIGYSNIISETLYSHGYKIIDQQKLQDQIGIKQGKLFCDNPGFEDTRGTSYEICTHLSMDRAIEVCQEISKIVLIISEEVIKSERGIHLIRLMQNIYDRFPSLEDSSSNAFENFSILVTKARIKGRLDVNLDRYIETSLGQFRAKVQELKQQKNHLQTQSCLHRIKVYQNLKHMMKLEKIHFVNVMDQHERIQILSEYSQKSRPISKQSYRKCMESNNFKLFADQISICAHTWTELILSRYLEQIPAELLRITTSLRNKNKIIETNQGNSSKLIKQKQRVLKLINQKRQEKEKHQAQLERAINTYNIQMERKKLKLDISEHNLAQDDQMKFLAELEESISASQIYECNRQHRQKEEVQAKLKQLKMKSEVNIKRTNQWKSGYIKQQIISETYSYGQQFRYSQEIYSSEDRNFYLTKGQTLPSNNFVKIFKCGYETKQFGKIFKISRNYRLVPSKQFDPNNYLTKLNLQMGKYQATIQSKGYILENVVLFDNGKTLLLSVKIDFKKCTKEQQLPYLKITHRIPNEEHYSDAIKNAQAYNILLIKQIGSLQMQLENLENRQMQLKYEIITKQKSKFLPYQDKKKHVPSKLQVKLTSTGSVDLESYKKSKLRKIQDLGQEIKGMELTVQRVQNEISLNNDKIKRQKQDFSKLKREQDEARWLKKRFALLIKDQIQKKIPETLQKFIEITCISQQTNAQYKAEIFNDFKTRYNSVKVGLLAKCQRDLKNG